MKMASAEKTSGRKEKCLNGKRSSRHKEGPVVMDTQEAFSALHSVCEENMDFFSGEGGGAKGGASEAGRRLVRALALIQEHARCLEPIVHGFSTIYHHFDYDALVPANGYRSLVKVVRSCVLHIVHKGRYISSSRRSIFYRAAHNASEMEAYCSALCQLRALLYLAQRLLHDNAHGDLFLQEHSSLSLSLLREYASLHKGCFYGRCLGFQFTPAIRPCLQTIAIGLVAFGENYKRHQSGIVETGGITPYGVAASSLFTSGKYAIDPELRGAEFERITQNLDVHFWKSFWNVTETEVLSSLANMTSTQVKVNRTLSLPPMPFDLPLAADPKATVTIAPPSAHIGSAPVQMRLISHELREGQDSEALLSLCRPEGGARSLTLGLKAKPSPPSPCLMVHFHGGGFVAQTSKSHEPYLKSWSQDLGVPILSVDYSLAPEAPFPRALEECFYAYCWALKHCHLLGWTGECVCLAGDSAGGNLCITTAMRAVALGVRVPDGIMAAYPATLLSACASPSRLLTLMDPLLPLSVLSRCLAAYAGGDPPSDPPAERQVQRADSGLSLLLRDFRVGASNWVHSLLDPSRATVPPSATEDTPPPATVRSSVSEAFLSSLHSDPPLSDSKESLKSRTCQDLATHQNSASHNAPLLPEHTPDDVHFYLSEDESSSLSQALLSVASAPPGGQEAAGQGPPGEGPPSEFPLGFEPLRSEQPAIMHLQTSAAVRDPFCSPLLAPDSLLRGLPPVHIVACSLDPMLDDSVMLAKRLRGAQQPVTLCVVDDLPHGFLSLSQLSRETRAAADVCVERVRLVFDRRGTAPPEPRKHRRLERTGGARPIAPGDRTVGDGEGPVATAAQGNGAVGGVGA